MKQNLWALCSLAFAVGVSSFTTKKAVNIYCIHNTAVGNQQDMFSYTCTQAVQTFEVGGTILDWFRITDADGILTFTEFDNAFDALDTDNDHTLNDQAEISNVLDKK